MTSKKKNSIAASRKKMKIKLQSFYTSSSKESQEVFKALDWAYWEAENAFYGCGKTQKTIGRLRDLAAVAVGKPTLAEDDD